MTADDVAFQPVFGQFFNQKFPDAFNIDIPFIFILIDFIAD